MFIREKCSYLQELQTYNEVDHVLEVLNKNYEDIPLGIASRIANISEAYQLLHLFKINHHFRYKHIYPGKKIAHFFQYVFFMGY